MKYSNLVIAIPHSSGHPHEAIGASWGNDPDVVRESDRWTDWFTDELFNSEIGDVDVVKCYGSRFDYRDMLPADVQAILDADLAEAKSHLFKEDVDYLKARYFIPIQHGGVHRFRQSYNYDQLPSRKKI